MRSMTGFGRGTAEHGGVRATVDVRAVNHRFLDLKLRGLPVAPDVEDAISARVRRIAERGAISVAIHAVRLAGAGRMRIDTVAAASAHLALTELARQLGLHGPDLALVLAQPGVATAAEELGEAADAAVIAAAEGALVQLAEMRDREGEALARELSARLHELDHLRAQLAERAAGQPGELQRRLEDRVRKLAADAAVEPARLAQEIALLAERADVTEELVRLDSHLGQARTLVAAKDAVGRRLDFLVQEIGREVNTIGSKSATIEITNLVVEAKAALEKVREQVQNVE